MWNPGHGQHPYPGHAYNQMGFHQTYERLQPGADQQYFSGDPRSPQHATQSFTSRYYDGAAFGAPAEDFPKPVGLLGRQNLHQQESFQSVALQSNAGSFTMGGFDTHLSEPAKKAAPKKKERVPFYLYVQYVRDHMFRIILWIGAAMIAVCSFYLLGCVVNTCLMGAFSTFSSLAWESYFPSFWAIMVLCAVFALGTFAVAFLGVFAGLKESKPLLRSFITASATLSFIILALALFSWLYGLRARPYVVRAANLMCQEIDVWRCDKVEPAPAVPGRRLDSALHEAPTLDLSAVLQGSGATSGHPLSRLADSTSSASSSGRRLGSATAGQVVTSFLSTFEDGRGRGVLSAAARRLNTAAKAVMAFEEGLSKQPTVDGVSGVCRMVNELCTAQPPMFSVSTSCVCNGQWDYAETGSNVTSSSPTARTGGHARRLASAAAAAGPGVAAQRRLQGDPWQGSIGDYCDSWSGAEDGDWCFVSSQQQCDVVGQREYKTQSGVVLTRSSGPCGDGVQSRSQYILDGLNAMLWSLKVSAVLGGLLALTALCGGMLFQSPSKATQWISKDARAPEYKGAVAGETKVKVAVDEYQQRERRFEEAQTEAVRKLNDDTPDDVKFMLYGFYNQATQGDVQGDRPGFFQSRERSKYDYWARHRGMSREEAIDGYVRTVQLLA